jgi:endoglucanase
MRQIPSYFIILLLLLFRFANDELFAQNLYINQNGYLPNAPKYIFTDDPFSEEFYLINEQTNDTVFYSAFFPHVAQDPATGLDLFEGDFSSISQQGNFHIKTASGLTTPSFLISEKVNSSLFKKSLKAFYFQRCGLDLLGEVAEPYYRSRCHRPDGFYHSSTDLTGFHAAPGGWHDAGDFGKYVVNAGITVGTLLMAYESFPIKFGQDDVNIPESGNGIPDILDEVRYELEWLLKMQDAGGGVFFKLTPEVFAPMIMPQDDESSRYIYELSTTATGNFSAVMARSARIYAQFDSVFSNNCLDAAERAWDYLDDNPGIVPEGGFTNPSGTITGQYGDSDDRDERLWAATELYTTTGKSDYHQYFKDHFEDKGILTGTMWWGDVTNLAQLSYLLADTSESSIKEDIRSALISQCQNFLAQRAGNGFYVLLSPGEYVWGSNSIPLNKAILLIFGHEQSGIESYLNAAMDQLNYILGVNVHKLSFVTSVGTNFVLNPHHRPSEPDKIDPAIPGLLAGGPDENLSDPTLSSLFDDSTPPAKCYVDNVDSYASNEIAINWNAPLVFVSGYLSRETATTIKKNSISTIPETIKLFPNFPNPFNPTTVIGYQLLAVSDVELEIYNQQGRIITTLVSEKQNIGYHQVIWDASGYASGIYYYILKTDAGIVKAKKLILLK